MDACNNCNEIHFGFVKCKRVTQSALSSDINAVVHGVNQSYFIKRALERFMDRDIPLRILRVSSIALPDLTLRPKNVLSH